MLSLHLAFAAVKRVLVLLVLFWSFPRQRRLHNVQTCIFKARWDVTTRRAICYLFGFVLPRLVGFGVYSLGTLSSEPSPAGVLQSSDRGGGSLAISGAWEVQLPHGEVQNQLPVVQCPTLLLA